MIQNQFNITKGIIILNIIVFIYFLFFNDSKYYLIELIISKYLHNRLIGCILGTFCHANLLHLIANMIAFYNLRNLELLIGSNYLKLILVSTIINSFFLSFFKVYGIGFSAVIFTLNTYYSKFSPIHFFYNKQLDKRLVELIKIAILFVLYPRSSLIGHLIGFSIGLVILELEKLIL